MLLRKHVDCNSCTTLGLPGDGADSGHLGGEPVISSLSLRRRRHVRFMLNRKQFVLCAASMLRNARGCPR